jgi:hypothetical protein
MIHFALTASNGADPLFPLIVIGIALLAVATGVTTLAISSDPYDHIGGGVFDRSRGDHGERPAPDAEYEEFAAAIAEYCVREEARESAERSDGLESRGQVAPGDARRTPPR